MPTPKKFPYRGVFSEAARLLKRHRNSVLRSYKRNNPDVVRLVDQLRKQRQGGSHASH